MVILLLAKLQNVRPTFFREWFKEVVHLVEMETGAEVVPHQLSTEATLATAGHNQTL